MPVHRWSTNYIRGKNLKSKDEKEKHWHSVVRYIGRNAGNIGFVRHGPRRRRLHSTHRCAYRCVLSPWQLKLISSQKNL